MKECSQNGRIHENCKDQCLFSIHSAIIFRIYVRDRQQRTSVSLLTGNIKLDRISSKVK